MKGNLLLPILSALGCSVAFATPIIVTDDFEGLDVGTIFSPPNNFWSAKWQEAPSEQANLVTIIADGQSGQGAALDVTVATSNYKSINQNGVTGDLIILEADVQLGITGAPLNELETGGLSGVNDPFASLLVSDNENWWTGTQKAFSISRRQDGIMGISVPFAPWITGWISNDNFGLDATGEVASQSGWFRMRMILTDDGTGNFEMDQELYGSNGQLLWTMSKVIFEEAPLGKKPTGIPVTSTVYGGFSTPWIGDGTTPIAENAKIDHLAFDNFSISGFSSTIDADGDNLTEADEALLGTDDTKKDTDGDDFDDDVEVAAGSDPLSDISNPVINILVDADFSEFPDGSLNDSADWVTQSAWNISGGVLSAASNWQRVILNKGIELAPGETAAMRVRFRVLGDADLSLTNHGILGAGFSPNNGSGTANTKAGGSVSSNRFANGLVKIAGSEYDITTTNNLFVQENAGSWFEAYDIAGYDDLDETAANMRTTGPSDWLELTIIATKLAADDTTPDGFQVQRILTDLEGDNQNTNELSTTLGGLTDLWGDSDGDSLIYPMIISSDLVSKSVDDGMGGMTEFNMTDGVEVAEFSAAKIVGGDYDGDNLSNLEELLLDTNAALADSDGDGVNDDVEIANGTDPLVNNNPGGSNRPTITTIQRNGSDLQLLFTGFPNTDFKLTESATLEGPFTDAAFSTSTDEDGAGFFSYPISGAKNFIRVEKE